MVANEELLSYCVIWASNNQMTKEFKLVLKQVCASDSTSFSGPISLAQFTVFAVNYIVQRLSDFLEPCLIASTCQMILSVGHEDNGNTLKYLYLPKQAGPENRNWTLLYMQLISNGD